MGMHGLMKIHNAAMKKAAIEDFEALMKWLNENGCDDLTAPLPIGGITKIDRLSAKVRASAIARLGKLPPITDDEKYTARQEARRV